MVRKTRIGPEYSARKNLFVLGRKDVSPHQLRSEEEGKSKSAQPASSVMIDSTLGLTSGALLGVTSGIVVSAATDATFGSTLPVFGIVIGGAVGLGIGVRVHLLKDKKKRRERIGQEQQAFPFVEILINTPDRPPELEDVSFNIIKNPEKEEGLWWIGKECVERLMASHGAMDRDEIVTIEGFHSLADIQAAFEN